MLARRIISRVRGHVSELPIVGRFAKPYHGIFGYKDSIFHMKGELHSNSFGKDLKRRKNGKILVVGIPKSGHNWLAPLIADSLKIPIVHPWRDYKKSGVTPIHSHWCPDIYSRNDFVAGAYIMRDLRDVIVSFYKFSQTERYKTEINPTCLFNDIDSFYFEYFLTKMVPRYDMFNHAEDYVSHGLPMVKYEDLWDDTIGELSRLFKRFGIDVPIKDIQEAVKMNDINRLKKTGKKTWRDMPKEHFRKGGYGGYKKILSDKVLDDINHRFGDYLRRWGY